MIDDLTLMAFVDGELTPDRRAGVEAAVAADPVLRARADAFRQVRTAARAAFPVSPDPRDAALAAMIAGAGRPAAASTAARIRRWIGGISLPQEATWGAVATACFVAGLGFGLFGQADSEGFALDRRGAIADPGLVKVLDGRTAAEGTDAQGRAVGLTFRAADGRWCRSFQSADDGVAGLACRQDDGWRAEAVAPLAATAGEVRTASSDTPPAVLAAVDALIGGETLDAAAEADAIRSRWR